MLAATKEQTLSASNDPCVFFPLAADPAELEARFGTTPELGKNSRRGFGRTHHTRHQGFDGVNSTTALGIEPVLVETRIRSRCTGHERDSESGLDFFIARHYASNLGRFLQPDEFTGGPVDAFSANDPLPSSPLPYALITNPQSLNKYTYTWNNPLRYTDPDGHFIDTLIDIGSVVYSASAVVADVITGSDQLKTDLKALGGDLVGVAVPGLTGVGAAIRAANKVDNVVDAARAVDKVSDATKAANKADNAADAGKATNATGSRPGQDFTPAGKRQIDARDGNQCQNCGREVQSVQNKKGQPTPPDQRQRHHIKPKSEGGSGTPENGKTLCPGCHKKEHQKLRKEKEAS
jgi:RHS repeat-associated protein